MAIRTITIVDTETTGFDPKKDKIIELAAILYSLTHAAPIASFATLIHYPTNAAECANGISVGLLKDTPKPYGGMAELMLNTFVNDSDALVAHNATFDRNFINAADLLLPDTKDVPWVCSMKHLAWPKPASSNSLMATAISHGVAITAAHRAMTDCDILARLLTRVHEMGHSLTKLFDATETPKVLVEALVTYSNRQLAKDAKFFWDQDENHPKKWLRECTEEEMAKFPFKCRAV